MITLFGANDYRELKDGETYENRFVIINADSFMNEYKSAKYQLFYATGGFGCNPSSRGRAVFGAFFDERCREESYNVLGVATEDAIKEWEDTYGMSRDVIIEMAKGE